MWFYSVVFFLLIGILSSGYFLKLQKASYWGCIVILILIAAFRPEECCRDYFNYIDYYNNISEMSITFLEPSFFVISWISKFIFNGPLGMFIIFSVLGVTLKGIAFLRLTKYYSLSLIIYFGSFYLLQEMTQIRVGVASAILLLSIPSIANKKPKEFISYLIIGTLFHYSFIAFGIVYFFDAKKINQWVYIGLIFFAFIAFNLGLNLASFLQIINLGFLSDKINAYKLLLDQGFFGDIQLINPLLFLRIIILIIFLCNWKRLSIKNEFSIILLKIYALSIFFFIIFADLPALAGRLSQLFGVVEIVIVPFFAYLLSSKYTAVFIAITFAILILYKQLYYSELMTGYF